ncbi:MAG: hypothetical protein LUG56_09970, partial [Lachnospiraceae bacterium]|nr:hypothetical protein [Lachnospiraceae bacterium]
MENVTIHGRSAHQMRRLHNRAEKEAVKEAEKRRRERLIFWLLAAAICVMRLWYIRELHAPFLLDDEIGYWSHAANLAGLSWTGTETLWYSYGYSLLLAPLFLVSHNME